MSAPCPVDMSLPYRGQNSLLYWGSSGGSLGKWVKHMPHLYTLIRIRKSTVHALCAWDLQDKCPNDLVVLDTDRNLTGSTREAALEIANTR